MKGISQKIGIFTITLILGAILCNAQSAWATAHKLLSEKDYIAQTKGEKESFSATLSVPDDFKNSPTWLTLYNGYGNRPGFGWVKVSIGPSAKDKDGKSETLADEHTFLRTHAKSIDLTGYFVDGPRQLSIEGAGDKGAYFAWTLTGAPSVLSLFNATKVTPGQKFLVHGVGFGVDKDKVTVTINGQDSLILSIKDSMMAVRAPEKLEGDAVTLRVKVLDKLSNQLSILTDYVPPHLTSISPQGGNTGATVTIRGSYFSRVPEENLVMVGPNQAKVLQAMDTETLVISVPDLGISTDTLPLTVTTNGIKSDNYLNFWCGDNFF